MFSTRTLDIEKRDEQRRLSDLSPRESMVSHSALRYSPRTTVDESDWIELPFRFFSNGHHLSLPALSHRQSLLLHDKNPRDELPRYHSETNELTIQADAPGQGRRRAFLRMNWSDHEQIAFDSREVLAARMIDIDEVFADAALLDLSESNPDELFAAGPNNEVSEVLGDAYTELLRIRNQLRAARSTSLAVDVGGQ